jgi:RimJ/RimL family protein N-acetyltransferase
MEKAGMKYEGTFKQYMLLEDGNFHDCVIYAVTRQDWVEHSNNI